jgi:chromosome segregation ATPase
LLSIKTSVWTRLSSQEQSRLLSVLDIDTEIDDLNAQKNSLETEVADLETKKSNLNQQLQSLKAILSFLKGSPYLFRRVILKQEQILIRDVTRSIMGAVISLYTAQAEVCA